jgi:hypothetical protein
MELEGEDIFLCKDKPPKHRYPAWDLSLTLTPSGEATDRNKKAEGIRLHVFYNSHDPEYNASSDRHCELPLSISDFRAKVADVELVWQDYVLGRVEMNSIITAGQQLFNDIFGAGHITIPALDRLKAFLRETTEPLRIEINAQQQLQFPWQLLYIDNAAAAGGNPLDGFLGAKHNVVQNIEVSLGDSRRRQLLRFGGREKLHLSLQREIGDPLLLSSLEELSRPLERAGYLQLLKRDACNALIQELNRGKCSEDIMYFCCHGWGGSTLGESSHIRLSGKDIYPTEFEGALGGNALRFQPTVFINSCGGGNPGGAPLQSFVPVLLSGGASIVIGPVVIVDITKGLRFAEKFMEELFHGENRSEPEQEIIPDVFHRVKTRFLSEEKDATPLLFHCMMRVPVHLERRFRKSVERSGSDCIRRSKSGDSADL